MFRTRCLVALVLTGAFQAVLAQGGGDRAACRADVQKFCARPNGDNAGKIEDCLIDHQQQISDGCYDFLKANLSKPSSGADACRADVPQFCRGVQAGGGRITECLIDHQKEISDGCYDFLSKQKSAQAGNASTSSERPPAAPSGPIYRSRQADGRIVYSDTPQPDAVIEREVQLPPGNSALPPR